MRSHGSFDPGELHVIAVVHNPLRFKSRHRLFEEFVIRMRQAGVTLHIVEAAFGDRYHDHVEQGHDRHILLVQNQELWVKESMINVGFSRLPDDWKYAAWIDGDVSFTRLDWAQETIHQLQHFRIVQMFQTAADLGPDGEIIQVFNGFGYSRSRGLPELLNNSDKIQHEGDCTCGAYGGEHHAGCHYHHHGHGHRGSSGKFWHPGFAWAIRRDTFDHMGGLVDWSILGSADHLMALAWIGRVRKAVPSGLNPAFLRKALEYQDVCDEVVRGDIGYVPGTLTHWWHGKKRDRRYVDRWEILKRHCFDPDRDIRRDHQGLIQLTRSGERLRDDLRGYFRARNEDSLDME